MVVKVVHLVHETTKNTTKIGIGYLEMSLKKLRKKMLRTYHRILKASVKKKFEDADELNWKLLQLELKLRKLDES